MASATSARRPFPTATQQARIVYQTRDLNDVIIVGGKYTVIPSKLFLNANYTYSRGLSRWSQDCGPTGLVE